MKKQRYALGFLLLMVVSGCSTPSGGFFVQRTQDTYDLQVGGAVEQPEWSFYRGAYEICKRDHQSGFEVKSKDWKNYGGGGSGIEGSIKCTGKVDPFLEKKYENSPRTFKVERSSLIDPAGYKYELVPKE